MEAIGQKCGCGNSNQPVRLELRTTEEKCPWITNENVEAKSTKHFIIGHIQASEWQVPQISTKLIWRDYLGVLMVRWGFKRNNYRVDPGLYAVGSPNEYSDVLVTANYKLTFDIVRKNLGGMNVWLLVLDTKGVNVWCAAGKGTFGTNELVRRIQLTSLEKIIIHRRLIIPQLGATGVAAHRVKQQSGFTVIYGPVRASGIRLFIESGYKTTKQMRLVSFSIYDRFKLIFNDIRYDLRYLLPLFIILAFYSGIHLQGYSVVQAFSRIPILTIILLAGYVSGVVLTPLFLPYIPTRNFSFKGFMMGSIVSIFLIIGDLFGNNTIENVAGIFFVSSFSSFLAMNFTGATTFTSLAGVKKEMRIAIPMQIASVFIAFVLMIIDTLIISG